ncbi:penicillin acylase family protein [Actinomadura keratinilytica]
MADAQAYIDGLNAYRVKAKKSRTFPGEYVLTGKIGAVTNIGEIEPFKLTDLIALASVVGGLFGNGGGGEVEAALSSSPRSRSTAWRRAPRYGRGSAAVRTPRRC